MRKSIVGVIIGVIILFISCIILPSYFISIITWREDLNRCQVAARNFVDMVIDNNHITDKAISDLNLDLAACSSVFTYEYYREEKVTNPGGTAGSVDVNWIYLNADENTEWRSGDIVTIVITQEGLNIYQRLAMLMPGAHYHVAEIRLSGMVR